MLRLRNVELFNLPPWCGGGPQRRTTPCPSLTDTVLLGFVSKFSRSWERRRKQEPVIICLIYSHLHPKLCDAPVTQKRIHIFGSIIQSQYVNRQGIFSVSNLGNLALGNEICIHKAVILWCFLCLQPLIARLVSHQSRMFSSTVVWNLN